MKENTCLLSTNDSTNHVNLLVILASHVSSWTQDTVTWGIWYKGHMTCISCQMLDIKHVRYQVIAVRCLVLSSNIPSDHMTKFNMWLSITCTQNTEFLNFKNIMCKYSILPLWQVAMRVVIHKEGLAMEAFLASSLLSYKEWLKFFYIFKRKWKRVKVKLRRKW